jgi:hypothetical protein
VLGPPSVISDAVVKDLGKFGKVHRIGPDPAVSKTIADPVDNAIAFSRYSRGSFGWGFTNAGNTYTIANMDRPLDAAPSALLASQGIPPALLLTDSGKDLPRNLQTALVNVQPGYEDDRRTVAYSRSWILGGDKAVSLPQQDEIDSLQQLVPIQANSP